MSGRHTPETDDLARGNHVVPTEWAQQLERERDEARKEIKDWKRLHEAVERGVDLTIAEGTISDLRKELNEWAAMCGRYKQERDEAKEDAVHWKSEWEIVEARLCGWKHPRDNGIIFEHEIIPKLQRERDEAREHLREIKEYGTEEINAALELRQKLAQALIERDEAREELQKLEGAYEDATNYYARIIELTDERDEARKEVKYWQELYRTVSVY